MTKAIDKAFKDAIEEGVFPSASVLVGRGDEVLYYQNFGGARDGTCFDVASLTKPIATATIAMMLYSQKLVKLDDTVYQWLAGARQPAHKLMTVSRLLNHTSGLPAWEPYYRELPISLVGTEAGKRIMIENCFDEPLEAEVGTKTIYSDIGYILLGEILEQGGDAALDEMFAKFVAKPLALGDSFFVRIMGAQINIDGKRSRNTAEQHVPSSKRATEKDEREYGAHRRFAPTEDCPWRGRVVAGQVHDQNAYALGGVAGHAGLFSTAKDLNRITAELTRSYRGESDWISKDIAREFLQVGKQKPAREEFVLGWNRPSRKHSASGQHFSPNSIGHLAYTGCSIWIDLDRDVRVILLTNRIHPSSTNQKIKGFRPLIHNLIFTELIEK